MTSGVFRTVPHRLAEYRRGDALGGPFEQRAGEAAADAVAHEDEFADAQMGP